MRESEPRQNKLGPAGVKDFLDQLPLQPKLFWRVFLDAVQEVARREFSRPLPKLNMLSLAENQFATATCQRQP